MCGRSRMENIKDELGDIARETEVIRNMVVLLAEKRQEAAMSRTPAAAVTVQQLSPPAVAYNAAAEDDSAPTVTRQVVARLMSRLDDERAQSSRLMHQLDTERAERARLAVALERSRAQRPPRGPPVDAMEASTKRLLRTISKTMGESSVVGSAVAIEAVVGRVLALRQERDRLQASGRQLSHQFEVMRRVHKREQAFNIGLINRLRGGSSEQPAAEPVAADAMHRVLQIEAPQTRALQSVAAAAVVRRERERTLTEQVPYDGQSCWPAPRY